jgi:hypothetical protein
MHYRHKLITGLAVFCVGALLGGAVHAGFKSFVSVSVKAGKKPPYVAKGDLGLAYGSNQPEETIGCTITATAAALSAECMAMSGEGVLAKCTTSDPNLISALYALNGDSHLEFQWEPTDKTKPGLGTCTSIVVGNSSSTKPK